MLQYHEQNTHLDLLILNQYFILNYPEKFLEEAPDLVLSSESKDFFFESMPKIKGKSLPWRLSIKDIPLRWSLEMGTKLLEKEIATGNYSKNQILEYLEMIKPLFGILGIEKKDNLNFLDSISEIKEKIFDLEGRGEYFVPKSKFKEIIFALNNPLRRKIISIVRENPLIKAGEIRRKINSSQQKKHSLASILKQLEILNSSDIIEKGNYRNYKLNMEKIILNLPLSWLKDD